MKSMKEVDKLVGPQYWRSIHSNKKYDLDVYEGIGEAAGWFSTDGGGAGAEYFKSKSEAMVRFNEVLRINKADSDPIAKPRNDSNMSFSDKLGECTEKMMTLDKRMDACEARMDSEKSSFVVKETKDGKFVVSVTINGTKQELDETFKSRAAAEKAAKDAIEYMRDDRADADTVFKPGDKVKSKVNAQGLTKGETYEISDVFQKSFGIMGTIVTYKLTNGLQIGNGHLVLSKADADRADGGSYDGWSREDFKAAIKKVQDEIDDRINRGQRIISESDPLSQKLRKLKSEMNKS